jgi:hypothetical protein
MRCPKCKSQLISSGLKRYETLEEHVLAPNMTENPLRNSYACSQGCFSENTFFNEDGDIYCSKGFLPEKYYYALDSLERRITVKMALELCSWETLRGKLRRIKAIRIEGEKDMPNLALIVLKMICWRLYFLINKIRKTNHRAACAAKS